MPFYIFSNSNYEHFHKEPASHYINETITDLFAEFGAVKSVKIITDNFTNHPGRFALLKWQKRLLKS
ncbi:hypothetical protein [Chitinophaga silvisoli]|uniref:hypothetical protein n=1 Tax=Chitinophaga silvisoli TaxID=2291814 RepID=UPI0013140DB0